MALQIKTGGEGRRGRVALERISQTCASAFRSRRVRTAALCAVLGVVSGCSDADAGDDEGGGGAGGATVWPTGGAGGASGTGGAGGAGGAAGGGSGGVGGDAASGGAGGLDAGSDAGALDTGSACALEAARLRVTDVQLPVAAVANEDEAALRPLVIAPLPNGGSRLAFMGSDGDVHIVELDAADQPTGAALALPAHDFSDLYADAAGGVLLLTRAAEGGGTLNCGNPANLCGVPPSPPIPCFDMFMVRFDGASETWATKLTDSSAALPPYSTGPTGGRVFMIWWYAHHGRIAFDGARYAGYYGAAISVSEGGCINIHQGDRMQVVSAGGTLDGSDGFEWGCSHSGYERVLYDADADAWISVCKTDNNNRIAFAPDYRTIRPVDLGASNLGELVKASGEGYWLPASDARAGAAGMADVHLLRFTDGAADVDTTLECADGRNCRAPHLAPYADDGMVLAWESSTAGGDLSANDAARRFHVQARSRASGEAIGDALEVPGLRGNRYHALRGFPDGSAVFVAKGASATEAKVLRVLPCR